MQEAYRNLTRRCWSIREGGRVVGHAPSLALRDVSFVVSTAGVRRVQARRQREVVAVARGIPVDATMPPGAVRVRFDPYGIPDFILQDGTPVSAAALAFFLTDGSCWAVMEHPGCASP